MIHLISDKYIFISVTAGYKIEHRKMSKKVFVSATQRKTQAHMAKVFPLYLVESPIHQETVLCFFLKDVLSLCGISILPFISLFF